MDHGSSSSCGGGRRSSRHCRNGSIVSDKDIPLFSLAIQDVDGGSRIDDQVQQAASIPPSPNLLPSADEDQGLGVKRVLPPAMSPHIRQRNTVSFSETVISKTFHANSPPCRRKKLSGGATEDDVSLLDDGIVPRRDAAVKPKPILCNNGGINNINLEVLEDAVRAEEEDDVSMMNDSDLKRSSWPVRESKSSRMWMRMVAMRNTRIDTSVSSNSVMHVNWSLTKSLNSISEESGGGASLAPKPNDSGFVSAELAQ